MDPHSRFSPFNTRHPKAGPLLSSSRTMEASIKTTNPLENFKKRPMEPKRSSSSSPMPSRPIVTNSRIKQDEQYRKDMYLAFINNALQQKLKGISDTFDELVDQFNPKPSTGNAPTPSPQLKLWVVALSHVVSRLERSHSALVEAVVGVPWTTMDPSFVKSYTSFIGMLVSAKPEYLSVILDKVACGFTHQSGLRALDSGIPETSSSPLTRRVVYDRLHYLLQHLLSLVPTLSSTLQPLLVRHFPHKRQSQAAQVTYIRNLLRVTEYSPELSDRILATIVDRAIQIDVEIQVELEELEEHAPDDQVEIFDLDPFDTVLGQEENESDSDDSDDEGDNLSDLSSDAEGDGDNSDDPPPDEPSNMQHVQDMVNKLDAILKNLFDYFKRSNTALDPPTSTLGFPRSTSPSSSSSSSVELAQPLPTETAEQTKALRRSQFYILLSIFDRTILRTFKSRYTQFLVFWFSSLDPEFSDLFQGMLVSKALLEEDQPAVTRAAAASYISSFVSRAEFVDRDSTRRVMSCLCNFLKNRMDIFDAVTQSGAVPLSMSHHSIFYAVSQAVFLIFCFRWRDLLYDPEDLDELANNETPTSKWMKELEVLRRVVHSELNPLKVCSANVVMQFARVAHATDFLYCYSIIEANRRSDYAPNSLQAGSGSKKFPSRGPSIPLGLLSQSMHAELNSFFPFDPYKLPRSSSYIEPVYREWSSVAIDDDEDEEEDEAEADVGEQEHLAVPGALSANRPALDRGQTTDGLDLSFGGMSISPIRSAKLSGMAMSFS